MAEGGYTCIKDQTEKTDTANFVGEDSGLPEGAEESDVRDASDNVNTSPEGINANDDEWKETPPITDPKSERNQKRAIEEELAYDFQKSSGVGSDSSENPSGENIPRHEGNQADDRVEKSSWTIDYKHEDDGISNNRTEDNAVCDPGSSNIADQENKGQKEPNRVEVLPKSPDDVQNVAIPKSPSAGGTAPSKIRPMPNSNTLPLVPPMSVAKQNTPTMQVLGGKKRNGARKKARSPNARSDIKTAPKPPGPEEDALFDRDRSSTPAPDGSQSSVQDDEAGHKAEGFAAYQSEETEVPTSQNQESGVLGQNSVDAPQTETQTKPATTAAASSPVPTGFPELPEDEGRGDDSGVCSAESNSRSSSSPVPPCPLVDPSAVRTNPASPQPASGPTEHSSRYSFQESGDDVRLTAEEPDFKEPRPTPQGMSLALPQRIASSPYLCRFQGQRVEESPGDVAGPVHSGALPTPPGAAVERPVASYDVHEDLNVSEVPLSLLTEGAVGGLSTMSAVRSSGVTRTTATVRSSGITTTSTGTPLTAVRSSGITTTSATTSLTAIRSSGITTTSTATSITAVRSSGITRTTATSITAGQSSGITATTATSMTTAVRSSGITTTSTATFTTTTVTTAVASSTTTFSITSSSTYRSSFVSSQDIGIRHSPRITLVPFSRQPAPLPLPQRHRPPIFVPSLGPLVLLRWRFEVEEEDAVVDAQNVTVSLVDGEVLPDNIDLPRTEGTDGPQEFTFADELELFEGSGDDTQGSGNTGGDREIAANELVGLLNVPRHQLMGEMMRRFGWAGDGAGDNFCQVCRRRRVNVITFQCHHTVLCHLCVRTCSTCPARDCQRRHIEFYFRFDLNDGDDDGGDV